MLGKLLLKFIEAHGMFLPGDTVIVGVSGGADSVALLHLLAGIENYRLRLVVAHVNHLLRGSESDEDEAFVHGLADALSCPYEVRRIDVAHYAVEHGISLEDAGRKVRYGFFQELMDHYAARAIVVAHTADDQAETLLIRLLRGACGTGLRAMLPVTDRGIVRPLLGIRRCEIERYLADKGAAWRTDSSNSDKSFLRNRIRAELLPILQQYNPSIQQNLVTTAHVLALDEELLDSLAAEAFTCLATQDVDSITFAIGELAGQPAALRLRLIRKAISHVKGDLRSISAKHVFSVESLLFTEKPNAVVVLPEGYSVRRAYGNLVFGLQNQNVAQFEITIDSAGEYRLQSGVSLIVSRVTEGEMPSALSLGRTLIDGQVAPFPWILRSFSAGDRIRLAGMEGRKKVKKIFMEQEVPVMERRSVPLLFCGEDLLWVCGIRRSAEALPVPGSNSLYALELK